MSILILVLIYVVLADRFAMYSIDNKFGYSSTFWIGILLTPFFGYLISKFSKKLTPSEIKDKELNEWAKAYLNSDKFPKYKFKMSRVVRVIIAMNFIMYMITALLLLINPPLIQSLVLYPIHTSNMHIYQFVTHLFLHSGSAHLFGNIFVLSIFGPVVERYLGVKRFIILFLLCGIIGGLAQIFNCNYSLVGASGAIFGLVGFFMMIDRSYFIILPLYIFAGVNILFEIIHINDKDFIGHYAHVFGALVGILSYIYIRHENKKIKQSEDSN